MRLLEVLQTVNWWAVAAIVFVVSMFLLILAPGWGDAWALASGFAAMTCAVLSVTERLGTMADQITRVEVLLVQRLEHLEDRKK